MGVYRELEHLNSKETGGEKLSPQEEERREALRDEYAEQGG